MTDSIEITEIGEKIRICSYNTDRFKTSLLSVNIALPLNENASANAILPYLLSSSSKKYPDFTTLNKELDLLYGASLSASVSKIGEAQILRLSMDVIDDRFCLDDGSVFNSAAEMLCELLFYPKLSSDCCFDENELCREKRLLKEKLEIEKGEKRRYALRCAEKIMFENEPFGLNEKGTEDGIDALDGKTVYNAWKNAVSKGIIQINIVTDSDTTYAVSMFTSAVKGFGRSNLFTINNTLISSAKEVKRASETMELNQGKLVMGYRAGYNDKEDDFAVFSVMNDLFGGNTYSRLFMNVREKMSLCYYCSSSFNRNKGVVFVQSGVDNENMEKAVNEIGNQLADIVSGELTQSDLTASVMSTRDSIRKIYDAPESIDLWCLYSICDETVLLPEEYSEAVSKVTLPKVTEAASRLTLDTVFELLSEEKDGKTNN